MCIVKVRGGRTDIDITYVDSIEKLHNALKVYMVNGIVLNLKYTDTEWLDYEYRLLNEALSKDMKKRKLKKVTNA